MAPWIGWNSVFLIQNMPMSEEAFYQEEMQKSAMA